MEPRLEANLVNWNSRVRVHVESRFYDVEGWLLRTPGPPSREIEALGDLEGKTLVHLQCHFGMDTMQWARAGATVTGLDFSPASIDEAISLAERAGLSERASFVCANIYDAPQALSGKRFDVVYVSLGALCWLPDVTAWGGVVADLLAPGAGCISTTVTRLLHVWTMAESGSSTATSKSPIVRSPLTVL